MFYQGYVPREPSDFPQRETAPVAYTPDRLVHNYEVDSDNTEMMVVHSETLKMGETYFISGRNLRVTRETDIAEFKVRCGKPDGSEAPRFVRAMKFYVAVP
jgi:hypothetical protein